METSKPTIQPIGADHELDRLEPIARAIWEQHYTPIIGAEQVEYMLDKFQSARAMQAQIADGYRYYVLSDRDQWIGYFAIQKQDKDLFVSKVYLLTSYRGKGYGRLMMDHIEILAREMDCIQLRLTVNKYNADSIAFYNRLGYIKLHDAVFDIGSGYVMDDFVLVKELA